MPSTKLDQQTLMGEQLHVLQQQQAPDHHHATPDGLSTWGSGGEGMREGEEQDAYAAPAQPAQRVKKPFEDIM
jgi:hypothetical protein